MLTMAASYRGQQELRPDERHTVLVGPRSEFLPEHLADFVHADTLDMAARHLVRILRRANFTVNHTMADNDA